MEFDREELKEKLSVSILAVDKRAYTPVMSHLHFSRKHMISYNDFIGVRISNESNFNVCIPAETLQKLVGSVASKMVRLTLQDETAYFKTGSKGRGVRAKIPTLPEDYFLECFKWPPLKTTKTKSLSVPEVDRFLNGLKLCLTSVGNEHPRQMGVVLTERKGTLTMYSSDNRSVSRYRMKLDAGMFSGQLADTSFCEAIIKACDVFGKEDVNIHAGKGFFVFQIGKSCEVLGKVSVDSVGADYSKLLSDLIPSDYKKRLLPYDNELREAFARSTLMVSDEIGHIATVHLVGKNCHVESKSAAGDLKSTASFKHKLSTDSRSFKVDVDSVKKVIDKTDRILFTENTLVFATANYLHCVSITEA